MQLGLSCTLSDRSSRNIDEKPVKAAISRSNSVSHPMVTASTTWRLTASIPTIAYLSDTTASLSELEYDGEGRVNWDNQHHQLRGGLRIFIDENDQEVLEDQVMLDPAAPG